MGGAVLELVTDGITLHPKQAALYELLGDLLFQQGQTDQAIGKLEWLINWIQNSARVRRWRNISSQGQYPIEMF